MNAMASQIIIVSIVCSTVCSGTDQRKRQSSASLAFVRGTTGDRHVDFPHKRRFPSLRASSAESVSIWWHHHVLFWLYYIVIDGFTYLCYSELYGWPLLWRHNEHDSVSYHQPRGCLLDRLFRRRSKKTSKLRVTGLCAGNSPGPVNSPHKGPVTRKMFPFDDVIMHWDIIDAQHPMLGLYRIATNLGPIYELKTSGFLGLVSSR